MNVPGIPALQIIQSADHVDQDVVNSMERIFSVIENTDPNNINRALEIKQALKQAALLICSYVPVGQGRNECIKGLVEINRKARDTIALGGGGI